MKSGAQHRWQANICQEFRLHIKTRHCITFYRNSSFIQRRFRLHSHGEQYFLLCFLLFSMDNESTRFFSLQKRKTSESRERDANSVWPSNRYTCKSVFCMLRWPWQFSVLFRTPRPQEWWHCVGVMASGVSCFGRGGGLPQKRQRKRRVMSKALLAHTPPPLPVFLKEVAREFHSSAHPNSVAVQS